MRVWLHQWSSAVLDTSLDDLDNRHFFGELLQHGRPRKVGESQLGHRNQSREPLPVRVVLSTHKHMLPFHPNIGPPLSYQR